MGHLTKVGQFLSALMMFALVFWIDEKRFSVVETDDIVLDKFHNGILKEGIICPVKWRERKSGRKIQESLYDAEIKAISGTLETFSIIASPISILKSTTHGAKVA